MGVKQPFDFDWSQVEFGVMKLTDMTPNPNNPRTITADQLSTLRKSLTDGPRNLLLNPIKIDSNNVILGGNQRHTGLLELGYIEAPFIKAGPKFTQDEIRQFIVMDNVPAGAWNIPELSNQYEWEELSEWGVDIPDWRGTTEEAEEDDYTEPDNIQVDVVLGDLIEIGEHRLLCGDSTDADQVAKLMNGEKANMVFTSPPYNANTKAGQGDIFNKKKSVKLYSDGYSDNLESSNYVDFASSILNNCFLFTDGHIFWNVSYNANSRFEYIQQIQNHLEYLIEQICWKKSSTIPFKGSLMRDWEPIYVFSTNGNMLGLDTVYSNHWEISNTHSQQDNHKACFPVELPSRAIRLNDSYKVIFEPFTGSGSTMVAAHQLKRKCYGMELDPKYCQVIIDRMHKLDDSLEIKINGKKYTPKPEA